MVIASCLSHHSRTPRDRTGIASLSPSDNLPVMTCATCIRLETERSSRAQIFAVAISAMNAVAGASDNNDEYMKLRAAVRAAEINLELAQAELEQHRDTRHATVH